MKVKVPKVDPQIVDPPSAVFEIPLCGDWLNSNRSLFWAEKARLVKAWRHAAYIVGRSSRTQFTQQVDVVGIVHKRRVSGRWDPHNLNPTTKPCLDGLVDAGVLGDDDTKHVRRVSMEAGAPDALRPRLTLVITPVAAVGESL